MQKSYLSPIAQKYIEAEDDKNSCLYRSLIESNFYDNVTFYNNDRINQKQCTTFKPITGSLMGVVAPDLSVVYPFKNIFFKESFSYHDTRMKTQSNNRQKEWNNVKELFNSSDVNKIWRYATTYILALTENGQIALKVIWITLNRSVKLN